MLTEQVWLVTSPWNVTVGVAANADPDNAANENKASIVLIEVFVFTFSCPLFIDCLLKYFM